jgi:phenylacetate-CoA ligase
VATGPDRPRGRPRVAGTVDSTVPGLFWPALPNARTMAILALHEQLRDSEWWPAERLAAMQLRQLAVLLSHASRTVPHYRATLPGSGHVGAELLRTLPILTRAQVQADPAALLSDAVPEAHLPVKAVRSSGSTGRPVELRSTSVTMLFRHALYLREQRWHGRDPSLKAATIRNRPATQKPPQEDKRGPGWIPGYVSTTMDELAIRAPVDEQLEWLQRVQPAYLSTFPTNLRALALEAMARGTGLPGLRQVSTFAESLPGDLRDLVRRAFGVPVMDIYSSEETGPIAFQCPAHEYLYHQQSENLIVEVVDDAGQPCAHAVAGRVLVTDLHNLATPLIRYEIGDYAETGPACECGRGLPVLARVLGRTRNMMRMSGGRTRWPSLPSGDELGRIAPVRQFQLVQKDLQRLDLTLVATRPLSKQEEERVRAAFLADLGDKFELRLQYADTIARAPNGKYEDFRCEMASV